jgi:zinc/manganese transport system permease protein
VLSNELISIVLPALTAGLIIALTHAPLGLEVLKRGIIFIDLAIAQFAGLGVVFANILWHEPVWWLTQSLALVFALSGAILFRFVEKKLPQEQEAIIGSSFVVAASVALLILSDNPHGGEEIQQLLSGQILFVSLQDVTMHAPIYGIILALWFFLPDKARQGNLFYLLFAIAVTSSVQLVGVYVVFASLILPAIAASPYKQKQAVAWACGIGSVIVGISASIITDAPAGSVIVISYAMTALVIRIVKINKFLK